MMNLDCEMQCLDLLHYVDSLHYAENTYILLFNLKYQVEYCYMTNCFGHVLFDEMGDTTNG